MKMLRWIDGHILRDRIKNACIHSKLEVAPIKNIMREPVMMVWTCVTTTVMGHQLGKLKVLES